MDKIKWLNSYERWRNNIVAYDETTLRNEIANANDGDIIEITNDIYISDIIGIAKNITIQSVAGNNFTIFQQTTDRHFSLTPSGAGGTLTMKNITLDGMNVGGGISSGSGGHLYMDAGGVIQNCFAHNGGAISMNAAGTGISVTAVMRSGSMIQNCSSELHGGGVYVDFNSSLTMENGSVIRECVSKEYGGGIYVMEGSFFMNGGEISNCHSIGGGGIFLFYTDAGPSLANIVMNGGRITGCSAPFGGGILFLNTERVAAVNTVVTGNYSGTYGGGIAILAGSLSKINTALVNGNTAQLAEGPDAQIYVLADHYYSGNEYTLIDHKSSGKPVALLNGEERNPIFFKVRDNNTGEYLAAFCGELAENVSPDNYYAYYFLPNTQLNREQTDKIAITIRTALRGIKAYDIVEGDAELSLRAYIAQYTIWNIVAGYYSSNELVTTIDRIRIAFGDSAADCLDEIVMEMRRFENRTLPSFAGSTSSSAATCYLKYDGSDGKYKVTLTDANGVLSYFTIDPNSLPQGVEVIFDYDNNTMTIICDDKSILRSGNVIIRLVSLFEEGDSSVYFHPLYQDLVIPDSRYEITINAYIKPLIEEPKPTPKKPCPCYAKATKCRKTFKGKKIWIDNGNKENTRPKIVEILLLRDGKVYKSIIIDSADDEAFIFCCVPIGKKPGHKYDYRIDEANVPAGYTKTVEGYNVINTLNP